MAGSDGRTSELQSLTRSLRIMFGAMVASCVLYVVVLASLSDQIESRSLGALRIALVILCLGVSGSVLFVRFVLIGRLLAAELPTDLGPLLTKFRVLYVLCYVLCESVALSGFALRFLGEKPATAAPFFAAAVILFGLCYPKLPGGPISSARKV